MKDVRGFTLLELLMVVIIIAILASIALPQYTKAVKRARSAEALQLLAAIRGSELRYKVASKTAIFTATVGELDIDVSNTSQWNFSVNLTPIDAIASGVANSAVAGDTIQTDLLSGNICAGNAAQGAIYGLSTVNSGDCI